LLFRRTAVNQSVNVQTEGDARVRHDPPDDPDDPDDRRERELDADDRTPEEAGYGYGV
jgi:hypothetical protein